MIVLPWFLSRFSGSSLASSSLVAFGKSSRRRGFLPDNTMTKEAHMSVDGRARLCITGRTAFQSFSSLLRALPILCILLFRLLCELLFVPCFTLLSSCSREPPIGSLFVRAHGVLSCQGRSVAVLDMQWLSGSRSVIESPSVTVPQDAGAKQT